MWVKYFHQTIPFIRTLLHIYIIYKISLIKGLLLLWIFYKLYDFIMLKIYKLERISTNDMTFMWNTPEQTYNIITALSLDKMDKEGIKNLLIERGIKKFRKLRSKLTFKFFDWWWEEVRIEESLKRIEVVGKDTIKNVNIKNKEDLTNWAYQELAIKFNLEEELPFKFMILENVENSENGNEYKNLLIMKVDHCLADGVSFMNFICGLADNYNIKLFPITMSKSINFFHHLLSLIVFPFYLIMVAYRTFIVLKPVKTPFKCDKSVTGRPVIALSEKINLDDYIKINKSLGITFNDLMTNVISAATKKYLISLNLEVPPHILFCYPINMKPLPKNLDDIVITNNSAGLACKVNLIDDVFNEFKVISKELGSFLRNYNFAKANKIIAERLWIHLPFYISSTIALKIYNSYDMTISNVPGPKEHLYYSGCKVLDIIPMFTSGFIHSFLGIISYGGYFKFVVIHDSAVEYHPDNYLKFIMDEINIVKEKFDVINSHTHSYSHFENKEDKKYK